MAEFNSILVPLDSLLLDPNNYRFQDEPDFVFAESSRFHEDTVQARARRRVRDEGLVELKNSILKNGFLPVERIVVAPYEPAEGKYLVLEGNRRVAALRWIAEDHEAGVAVPPEVLATLAAVPVLVVTDAEASFVAALLGIRHVSGIREWGGYQRAKLVAQLRDENALDTNEVAERLAMTPHEVNRRYRAFKGLTQMQDSEDFGGYAEPTLYPVFHEAVSSPVVREWLGWSDAEARFAEGTELDQFYALVSPQESEDGEARSAKVATREQARELRAILANDEAKRVLLDQSRPFIDAMAVVRRDATVDAWRSQVAASIDTLESIGLTDLRNMTPDDLAQLEKLRHTCGDVILSHEKLTA